ncbi:hypothetical protein [Nocardioides pantholopis]|uniref:hypothetical protein n=1 Tax=Nocardioides pantholopis TaxID=2483798 RepID=UPI000F099A97|nr:hypothetical protein [Nocardioides pantholopis]
MRISRPLAGLISAALLGLVPLATSASPAAAAEGTSTSFSATKKSFTYGDPLGLYLGGSVNTATGTAYEGAAYLQMLPKGSSTWTNVAVDTAPGYLYFNVKATRNALYRVAYVGSARFSPSTSAAVNIKVKRKLAIKNPRGTLIKGTVKPKYKRGKVVIQRKVGKKWKKYKTMRANKKGKFSTTHKVFGSRTNYRLILPANKAFSKTVHRYYTYKY